jgi:hypothetical protein
MTSHPRESVFWEPISRAFLHLVVSAFCTSFCASFCTARPDFRKVPHFPW